MTGSSIQETIAARKRAMIPPRLTKGAAVLGRLWRDGVRCVSEWSGVCPCASPNDFCLSKRKWLDLVKEMWGGKYPHGLSGCETFLVLECMDEAQFVATGLTILKAIPGSAVPIRIGRKGTCFQTIYDLAALEGTPEYAGAVEAVVKIQAVGL